jgi:hypothetical protein
MEELELEESQLIFAVPDPITEAGYQDEIDLTNVGIVQPLDNPFNIFLNLKQLIEPDDRFVYFFIYSMGKRKIILWGVYDKQLQTFNIDEACRYNPEQLYMTTMNWIKRGYKYIGNTVVNRPLVLMSKYLDEPRMTHDEYSQKKYLLGYLDGKVSLELYENKYGPIEKDLPEEDYEILDFKDELELELKDYEKDINLIDVTIKGLDNHLLITINKIMKRFHDAVALGKINTDYYEKMLQKCPSYDKCTESIDESCGLYFYGNRDYGMLYKDDLGDSIL